MRDTDLFAVLFGDAEVYDAWGRDVAGGDWLGREVFYQAPLYPYFLGAVYAVLGADPFHARAVQAVLGAGACWLLFDAGRLFFSRPVGIAAGLLLAVYPSAVFFDGAIQKSALDLALTAATLCLLAHQLDAPGRWRWLALGAVLGCLALTRENALVLLPLLAAWLWLYYRPAPSRERGAWIALLGLGAALVLLPVGVRNSVLGGELHLTTAQLGPNLFIGNSARATGRYVALRPSRGAASAERIDATDLAEAAMGRPLSPAEVSGYWTRQALSWIAEQPTDWLRLMAKKWMLTWNAAEVTDTEDQATYAEASRLLGLLNPWLHFGVLCPLAAAGVALTWKRRRRLAILYAMVIALALSVSVFYVVARYRYPLVPFLALFAAAVVGAADALRSRRWPALAAALGIGGAAAVAANWPLITPGSQRAPTHHNLGIALASRGDLEGARRHFVEAIRLDPALGLAWGNLGALYGMQGDLAEAERHLREALRREPGLAESHANLAGILAARGESDAAVAHYREAIRLHPRFASARIRLGLELLARGHAAEALPELEVAVRLSPDEALAHYGLGLALAAQGRKESAAEQLDRARTLAERDGDATLAAEIEKAAAGD